MSEEFEHAAAAFGSRGALLGLDLGDKTIGVATCDPNRMVATPVETIPRRKLTQDAERLKSLADERQAVGLVIGMPLNMDGSEGKRAQSTRSLSKHIQRITELPVAFWDERLSTVAMERELIKFDVSRSKRAQQIDASAAMFILQGAIDRLRALSDREGA